MESKVFRTAITTLLESLDHTSKPFRKICFTTIVNNYYNNQRNKSSEKTPENSVPNFSSKENSNYIKEDVHPIKDDVTDFCIDGTATKRDNTEKEKQFEKKISLNKKHRYTEREEHGITTDEKSENVIAKPVLAHTHTDEDRSSASR